MATNKFLTFLSDKIQLVTAIVSSAGAGDAGKMVSTDTDGRLHPTVMPTGIAPDTVSVVSSENLSAGDWVNIYDNAGTPNVRKADAANNRPISGYVLSSVTSPANATVYKSDTNTAKSGLTIGAYYYLSTTAGGQTTTAPTSSGNIIQGLGFADSSSSIAFQPTTPISVA